MLWTDTCSRCAERRTIAAFSRDRRLCATCSPYADCGNCGVTLAREQMVDMGGETWCVGCADALPVLEAKARYALQLNGGKVL